MRLSKRVLRDEKGASMIIVALAIVAIFGFGVLTTDLSLMQLAKIQLQNAVDAAALAGTMVLATTNEFDQAVNEAIRVGGLNVAIQDIPRPVLIDPDNVKIPGNVNGIEVTAYDSVTLYFLKVLDPLLENKGGVKAKATAAWSLVCGTDCLRPFCFPDRWTDSDGDSTWDPGEFYHQLITGYRALLDIGDQIILRLRQSSEEPRMNYYYAVDFPPINIGAPLEGESYYRNWIAGCEPYMVTIDDQLQIEPGNMRDVTTKELQKLINLDPGAYWDEDSSKVKGSNYPVSPRTIKVCAFDPILGVQTDGVHNFVTVSKIMALFIEEVNPGAEIVGRFMKMLTQGTTCSPNSFPGGFLLKVALVK